MVKDIGRFERLCKMLEEEYQRQLPIVDEEYGEKVSLPEKELLDGMEKAIENGDFITAYLYQLILDSLE